MQSRGELVSLKDIETLYTNISNKFTNIIAKNIKNIVEYEHPDGYILHNNVCIIIEHFEISATKTNRNGALYSVEISKLNRNWSNTNNKHAIYSEDYKYLYDSIRKGLDKHNKFEEYKKSLLNSGKITEKTRVINTVLIEEKTISIVYNPISTGYNWMCSCALFNHKVLDIISRYTSIDYIIYQDVLWIKNKAAYIIKNNMKRNYNTFYYYRPFYKNVLLDLIHISVEQEEK